MRMMVKERTMVMMKKREKKNKREGGDMICEIVQIYEDCLCRKKVSHVQDQ